jgi:hypothetical protein
VKAVELVTVCRRCNGYGRVGFMGVASMPCPRCNETGDDPRPDEPPNETVYHREEVEASAAA